VKYLVLAVALAWLISAPAQANPSQKYALPGVLTLELVPGAHFKNTGWFLVFPFTKGPQMAAWIEDDQGTYVATIFVTKKAEIRPESLPVWSHRPGRPTAIDAVSAATTVESVDKTGPSVDVTAGKYKVFLEVNLSYDWNRVWAQNLPVTDVHYNGVNGQPSLVYGAQISVGQGASVTAMAPWGIGSATGLDGAMNPSVGMDTALQILDSAKVSVVR